MWCMQGIFFISFGSFLNRSRMVGAILVVGITRNICMKLFLTWAIGSGVPFIRFYIFSSCGNNNLVDGIIRIICAKYL